MSHVPRRSLTFSLFALLVCALALVANAARAQTAGSKEEKEPPFHEYKGVSLGMTADEARKKLGSPTDKGDKQDFYAFNDNESCQVFYDDTKKVFAVSIMYTGGNNIPVPKSVLGIEADRKDDGTLYKLIRFPKAGYWVSYTRTSGDAPMTIVAIQKIQ